VKYWVIYCHKHIESGRRYIGLTSRTMERRWSQHIIQARNIKGNRSYFANAIHKYGKDAFSHEILAMSWDLEGANATEIIIIEQEGTRNPKKGFNPAKGGGSQLYPEKKNPWDCSEYREKMTKKIRDRAADPMWRAKVSANTAAMNASKSPEERSSLLRKAYAARLTREASFTEDEKLHALVIRSEASKKSGVAAFLKTDLAIKNHRAKCSKLSISDIEQISIMRASGYTQLEIAQIFGVDRKTVSYHEYKISGRVSEYLVWNKGKNLDPRHKLKISSTLLKDYCIRGHDMNQFRGSHGCRACQKLRNAARSSRKTVV